MSKIQFNHGIEIGEVEVEMTIEGTGGMNGIGAYEFWGQKCYDRGSFEFDGFTLLSVDKPEHLAACKAWVDSEENFDKMCEVASDEMSKQEEREMAKYGEMPEYD